jgi:hypothetical protein
VLNHLAEGYTLASFGGIIGASRDSLYEWAKVHEGFSDAIKKGRAKGQHLWEQRLSKQAIDGAGNTAAIIFAMKNLYQDDWAEKIINEHTGKNGGPIETVDMTDIEKARRVAFALAQASNAQQS